MPEVFRKERGDFLDTGLKVVDDHHRLAVLRAHLPAHPRKARAARLQVGDADDVLVAHPQRELPPGLADQLWVGFAQRGDALAVQPGVGLALVVA